MAQNVFSVFCLRSYVDGAHARNNFRLLQPLVCAVCRIVPMAFYIKINHHLRFDQSFHTSSGDWMWMHLCPFVIQMIIDNKPNSLTGPRASALHSVCICIIESLLQMTLKMMNFNCLWYGACMHDGALPCGILFQQNGADLAALEHLNIWQLMSRSPSSTGAARVKLVKKVCHIMNWNWGSSNFQGG